MEALEIMESGAMDAWGNGVDWTLKFVLILAVIMIIIVYKLSR